MVYILMLSLIFTVVGILKNKRFEYKKNIGLSILVYATIFRFMLADMGSDGSGNVVFSGNISFDGELLMPLIYLSYVIMLIGLLIYIYDDAIQ